MFNPQYIKMESHHQPQVEDLITAAMNKDEGRWAKQTFDFHFACVAQGIDSSREFNVALLNGEVIGIVGLHHYRWGPEQNIWLSWFAVRPDQQRKGVGQWLFTEMCKQARKKGYEKVFIETYQHATFDRAVKFYQQQGFREVGRIARYLADGSDMLVFQLNISKKYQN